jgi:predicted double-glycine peptidase
MRALAPILLLAAPCQPAVAAAVDPAIVSAPRVESFIERRYRGVVRQKYDFSCGSAALATLLRFHYGRDVDEEAVFRGMWRNGDRAQIRKVGFSLLDMKSYLEAHGLAADGFKVDLDKIRQVGLPGIALVTVDSYRHFVVVKGVSAGHVLIGDPALGMRMVPRDEFIRVWNGAYFIINHEQAAGKASFNRTSQWAALPNAPLGSRFTEPLSQQALALTAPFYGEF